MPLPLHRSLSSDNPRGGIASRTFFGGRLRRNRPRRIKSQGAERRPSELNILGCQGIVSSNYTLGKMQQAQNNVRVTKLELEDVVNRDKDTEAIFLAIHHLLAADNERSWQYIKFIDSVHVREDMNARAQLKQYGEKRQMLWDQVSRHAENKPIMFQLKLEIAADASVGSVVEVLQDVKGLNLARIEFGGALYGTRKTHVARKLAELFHNRSQSGGDERQEEPYLQEMIVLSLFYAGVDDKQVNNSSTPLLHECISNLEIILKAPEAEGGNTLEEQEKNDTSSSPIMDTDDSIRLVDLQLVAKNRSMAEDAPNRSNSSSMPSSKQSQRSTKRARRGGQRGGKELRRTKSMDDSSIPDYNWSAPNLASISSLPKRHLDGVDKKPDFRWDKVGGILCAETTA